MLPIEASRFRRQDTVTACSSKGFTTLSAPLDERLWRQRDPPEDAVSRTETLIVLHLYRSDKIPVPGKAMRWIGRVLGRHSGRRADWFKYAWALLFRKSEPHRTRAHTDMNEGPV